MIIRKLRMENFRGFCDKTIDFYDKSVVLLSAANGIGKTTTIDAIEWCLTGNIGRLKNAFDTRSTNDTDRRMNTDGILKNRNVDMTVSVKVTLWLLDGANETILCREQKKDELFPSASKVTINENEEIANDFIQKFVGDSFYNYHYCDVQKSFNIQSKKRSDLNALFSEFITNYDDQKQIAENIDIFANDVDRYIEEKTKLKKSYDTAIKTREEQLETARKKAKQIPYPTNIFYLDEKTEIVGLHKEELVAQKTEVENCGYLIAEKKLFKLVENESLMSQQSVIKRIITYWDTKKESIQRALDAGLMKNTDAITTLELKLRKLEKLSLLRETILQDGKSEIIFENNSTMKIEFETDAKVINEKEKKVKDLSAEINLLSKNNKMLKLLSYLSANKQEVINHRDLALKEKGSVRCPICGSDSFATLEKTLILKEADDYIRQNGESVKKKEIEKKLLGAKIENLYQKVINQTKTVVDKKKKELEIKISELNTLKDDMQPYFDAIKELQKTRREITIEGVTAENVKELLANVEEGILSESIENALRETYQKILTVLGYDYENEMIQQTYAKVKNLIKKSYKVSNFSYESFVSKLNALESILSNQTLIDLNQKQEDDIKKNQILDAEIKKLQILKNSALQRAKYIRDIVDELSKDEYEKIGPALSKFYNKLIRINSGDMINIVQENDGISLIDDKGKNIVNVLSNGQISIFMLAYFFAGINTRNEREKMKIYFIDDLTACMDDVNMLAFMDLLKYQVSSKATMDQLFFVTCDNRISKLFKYKLGGRRVELLELTEPDFV